MSGNKRDVTIVLPDKRLVANCAGLRSVPHPVRLIDLQPLKHTPGARAGNCPGCGVRFVSFDSRE